MANCVGLKSANVLLHVCLHGSNVSGKSLVSMDLRQVSKAWSCETLKQGVANTLGQQQPAEAVPPPVAPCCKLLFFFCFVLRWPLYRKKSYPCLETNKNKQKCFHQKQMVYIYIYISKNYIYIYHLLLVKAFLFISLFFQSQGKRRTWQSWAHGCANCPDAPHHVLPEV